MKQLILPIMLFLLGSYHFSCHPVTGDQQTPATDPLSDLMEGNKRFVSEHPRHPHSSGERVQALVSGQHPTVAVISCSDSRVPPEIIFDQGLGDLFVVRTAGNLLGGLEIGSIEYAVEHLGVTQVLVMGHRECGAIRAFIEGGTAPGHIRDIVDSIRQEKEISQLLMTNDKALDHCIRANIYHAIHQLTSQSDLIGEKYREGKLVIKGACYNLQEGTVEMLAEH